MSRNKAALLGIASIWPFIYSILGFFVFFLTFFTFPLSEGRNSSNLFDILFPVLFICHFLTVFLVLFLMSVYIFHVIKNKKLSEQSKLLWVILLIIANVLVLPIYWYIYIWKESDVVKF